MGFGRGQKASKILIDIVGALFQGTKNDKHDPNPARAMGNQKQKFDWPSWAICKDQFRPFAITISRHLQICNFYFQAWTDFWTFHLQTFLIWHFPKHKISYFSHSKSGFPTPHPLLYIKMISPVKSIECQLILLTFIVPLAWTSSLLPCLRVKG